MVNDSNRLLFIPSSHSLSGVDSGLFLISLGIQQTAAEVFPPSAELRIDNMAADHAKHNNRDGIAQLDKN